MKKSFKTFIALILGVLMLFSISACSNENTDNEQLNDIGISYVSGESEENGIVYTLESAYWNKSQSSSNGGPWRDKWTLWISIKIQNNTSESFTPSKRDFSVYYQIPEIEVEVRDWLHGNGGYSLSDIDYIKAGQTAYFSLIGNSFYENPTLKYTDKFYLSHKIQNELGYEYKTLNLGVLKELDAIMGKFDTLLYGNGLTIALLGRFKKLSNIETFDNFFNRFLFADKVEKTEFYNILNSNPFSNVYLAEKELPEIENFLKDNLYNITQNGFEVWIGARVFTDDSFFVKNVTCYYLALFNYWYNLNKPMFNSQEFQNIIHDCSQSFKILGIKNTYTLNYDSYLDEALGVKHMHGKFVDNFIDLQQMAYLYYFNDQGKQEFLYPFCAETNGYAKLVGLNKLKTSNMDRYDYDFLFSESISFGKLLIYGIRFADGFIIPEQLKEKYSKQDIRLMEYVDGHILHRLDVLYLTGRLESITIAYYEENDKERYERVFDKCKVKAVINYEKSSTIF